MQDEIMGEIDAETDERRKVKGAHYSALLTVH